jgi:CheY-like chemotaxis protein
MIRILLIGADKSHANDLARFLEGFRYRVVVRSSIGDICKELNCGEACFDAVVLDMSDDQPENWQSLEAIRNATATTRLGPMALCFSLVYRGPQMKLRAERKGARFIYVR